MENKRDSKERSFSVELSSREDLKNFTLTNGSSDTVLFEGVIGQLVQATFKEGIVLEVKGKNGTIRIDLKENEIQNSPNKMQVR
jgi:hypothetical protein